MKEKSIIKLNDKESNKFLSLNRRKPMPHRKLKTAVEKYQQRRHAGKKIYNPKLERELEFARKNPPLDNFEEFIAENFGEAANDLSSGKGA